MAVVERTGLHAPIVFHNPQIGSLGTGFTSIVSDLTASGTPYAQNWGGATTVLGTQPSGNTYSGAITRTHLVNAINDTNARIKSANLGTCLGLLTGPALLDRPRRVRPPRCTGRSGDAWKRSVALRRLLQRVARLHGLLMPRDHCSGLYHRAMHSAWRAAVVLALAALALDGGAAAAHAGTASGRPAQFTAYAGSAMT